MKGKYDFLTAIFINQKLFYLLNLFKSNKKIFNS